MYKELKEMQQKEINDFPMAFAFDEKDFKEGMKKLGLSVGDDVYWIGGGGFIRESDAEAFKELIKRHKDEREQAIEEDTAGTGYIYEMFTCELEDYEFCYDYDIDRVLHEMGYKLEEVKAKENLWHGLQLALNRYKEEMERYDY